MLDEPASAAIGAAAKIATTAAVSIAGTGIGLIVGPFVAGNAHYPRRSTGNHPADGNSLVLTPTTQGGRLKLLLTSGGIKNTSIRDALVELLGKPIAESTALFIPTGIYPFPGGAGMAWKAISGNSPSPLCDLGWKSLGVLELTALPTIQPESWVPTLRETDALLVWGGDVLYLRHWMQASGLAELLPSLSETTYVGVSAGSIVLTPYNCDAEFDLQFVPEGSDMGEDAGAGLGLVDFALRVHLDREGFDDSTLAEVEKWAAEIPAPTYAIDDETAVKVMDGTVEVVSEGHWKLLTPNGGAA